MDADRSRGFILQPGEGRSIDLGGFQMTVKATSHETGGAFSLLEADEPPDFGPPLHIHHDAAEAFYVLGGEYIIFLEERELLRPAAIVGYFDELSAAIKNDDADPEMLSEIALRYSMEVVGPLPEGYV